MKLINNYSIRSIFGNFISSNIIQNKLNPNEEVQLFTSIIFNECDDIKGKPDQIVTPLTDKQLVDINRSEYDLFLELIKTVNRPSSKDEIISQSDRLINEVSRRFHGEFYTPKIWVDEAHKMIVTEFGEDCYDEYVWWDPCCGVGNLTRDYKFKELYCSTLHQVDIDIMNQRDCNPESNKFQYDFLNDDVYLEGVMGLEQDKLEIEALGLVQAFKDNRKIMIIMNPPYKASVEMIDGSRNTKGSTKTMVNNLMKSSKFNQASNQLYCQFLYRLMLIKNKYKIKDFNICVFIQPTFLKSSSFKTFRQSFTESFSLNDSFLFNASEFSDVSKMFGVLFGVWSSKKDLRNSWKTKIIDVKSQNVIDQPLIYNSDNEISITEWYNSVTEKNEKISGLRVSNALSVKNENGFSYNDAIAFLNTSSYTGSFITSSYSILAKKITKTNFYTCLCIFACTTLLVNSWKTFQNPYLKPVKSKDFNQWEVDSLVYSLFHNQSRQDSMRNLPYTIKNVENEFFWLSNEQMMELADSHGFTEMYRDVKIFNQNRFVYNELTKVCPQLSQDAKDVLNKANELVIKTIDKRKQLHQLHPEWHLNAWDAGWYQIKLILKKYFKDDLKEFTLLYKKFENRMREGVYKFRFLKRDELRRI